jgi:hypothetical protein
MHGARAPYRERVPAAGRRRTPKAPATVRGRYTEWEKRDFSHPQADLLQEQEAGKNRPAPFEMTGGDVAAFVSELKLRPPKEHKVPGFQTPTNVVGVNANRRAPPNSGGKPRATKSDAVKKQRAGRMAGY